MIHTYDGILDPVPWTSHWQSSSSIAEISQRWHAGWTRRVLPPAHAPWRWVKLRFANRYIVACNSQFTWDRMLVYYDALWIYVLWYYSIVCVAVSMIYYRFCYWYDCCCYGYCRQSIAIFLYHFIWASEKKHSSFEGWADGLAYTIGCCLIYHQIPWKKHGRLVLGFQFDRATSQVWKLLCAVQIQFVHMRVTQDLNVDKDAAFGRFVIS